MRILLASKSPRRRELLEMLKLQFEVINIGDVKEEFPADLSPSLVAEYLSALKSKAYVPRLKEDELLITADTVVILDDKILGKPREEDEAAEMLRMLSGKTHQVVSGVTIATLNETVSFSSTTDVKFAELAEDEIDFYVENFHPLDKAGAYGIQEWIGCVAVEGIKGSYYNVMGLPVHRLYKELHRFVPLP